MANSEAFGGLLAGIAQGVSQMYVQKKEQERQLEDQDFQQQLLLAKLALESGTLTAEGEADLIENIGKTAGMLPANKKMANLLLRNFMGDLKTARPAAQPIPERPTATPTGGNAGAAVIDPKTMPARQYWTATGKLQEMERELQQTKALLQQQLETQEPFDRRATIFKSERDAAVRQQELFNQRALEIEREEAAEARKLREGAVPQEQFTLDSKGLKKVGEAPTGAAVHRITEPADRVTPKQQLVKDAVSRVDIEVRAHPNLSRLKPGNPKLTEYKRLLLIGRLRALGFSDQEASATADAAYLEAQTTPTAGPPEDPLGLLGRQ